MKDFTLVIPLRLASKRLKGKPLLKIKGLPIFVHIYYNLADYFKSIYIATADDKIIRACLEYNIPIERSLIPQVVGDLCAYSLLHPPPVGVVAEGHIRAIGQCYSGKSVGCVPHVDSDIGTIGDLHQVAPPVILVLHRPHAHQLVEIVVDVARCLPVDCLAQAITDRIVLEC